MIQFIKNLRGSRIFGQRGISIVGTVFALIILGVLGAALVGLVAMDQESRMRSIFREKAFYAVQAAFEYALREIKEGGYPIVTSKALGNSAFTTSITASERKISATGNSGSASKAHSITTDRLAFDCVDIDSSGMAVGGLSNNELQNIDVVRTCLNAINVASMKISWLPDMGETVQSIRIDGISVYDDPGGSGSGETIDITDTRTTASARINTIEFSSGISGKSITIDLIFTDSSEYAETIAVP